MNKQYLPKFTTLLLFFMSPLTAMDRGIVNEKKPIAEYNIYVEQKLSDELKSGEFISSKYHLYVLDRITTEFMAETNPRQGFENEILKHIDTYFAEGLGIRMGRRFFGWYWVQYEIIENDTAKYTIKKYYDQNIRGLMTPDACYDRRCYEYGYCWGLLPLSTSKKSLGKLFKYLFLYAAYRLSVYRGYLNPISFHFGLLLPKQVK